MAESVQQWNDLVDLARRNVQLGEARHEPGVLRPRPHGDQRLDLACTIGGTTRDQEQTCQRDYWLRRQGRRDASRLKVPHRPAGLL